MGKMIAPQSIVVATTSTGHYGKEGTLLRFVIVHSFALACMAGILVLLYTVVPPITDLVLR